MYFAVTKLVFDLDTKTAEDQKDLSALVEKIRARFKVCVMAANMSNDALAAIAIASLATSEERLTQQLDAIATFCEETGFGRIEAEQTLMDHLDAFNDDEKDEDLLLDDEDDLPN